MNSTLIVTKAREEAGMEISIEEARRPRSKSGRFVVESVEVGQEANAAGAQPKQIETNQTKPGPAQTAANPELRFRIFVIDTGWNQVASRVIKQNIALIRDLTHEEPLYYLDRDKSVALLRQYSSLIGRDPIISVHDLRAVHKNAVHHVHGFRMHLGLLHKEDQVLTALQMFARFLITHRAAKDLDRSVRKKLHRDGLAGVIEIIGGAEHKRLVEE
jgi:hypothetical protein